jgi:hypothetical protein
VVNLTPEKYASFYSKLVFAWFDTLAIKGWKNTLKETDLWGLAHENKFVIQFEFTFRIKLEKILPQKLINISKVV